MQENGISKVFVLVNQLKYIKYELIRYSLEKLIFKLFVRLKEKSLSIRPKVLDEKIILDSWALFSSIDHVGTQWNTVICKMLHTASKYTVIKVAILGTDFLVFFLRFF